MEISQHTPYTNNLKSEVCLCMRLRCWTTNHITKNNGYKFLVKFLPTYEHNAKSIWCTVSFATLSSFPWKGNGGYCEVHTSSSA